eukprot:m.331573 g.331573  ORF g.331573 m.331573 type:complete len:52 (+) comp20480_c0_seq3:113-268(+)
MSYFQQSAQAVADVSRSSGVCCNNGKLDDFTKKKLKNAVQNTFRPKESTLE